MGYSIREFDRNKDTEKLFGLWKKVLKKPERGRLDALYSDNPYGLSSSWMIYCDNEEDPVGSLTVFPIKIHNQRDTATIGINCDIITTKEHRTLGPAVMLARSLMRDAGELGYDILLAMPNEMSKPVFKRVGYKKVGDACRFSRILRSGNKLPQIIHNKFIILILSYLVDNFLQIVTLNHLMRFYYWIKRHDINEIDESMNSLNIHDTFCDMDIQSEISDFLSWRYKRVGTNGSRIFILRNKKMHKSNYIIYYELGNNVIIEKINSFSGNIAGFLLLSRFIDKMYEKRMETIQGLYWGPRKYNKIFKYLGFIKREVREVFAFYINNKYEIGNLDLEGHQWFDGDLDL